jgi:hypothetical protein
VAISYQTKGYPFPRRVASPEFLAKSRKVLGTVLGGVNDFHNRLEDGDGSGTTRITKPNSAGILVHLSVVAVAVYESWKPGYSVFFPFYVAS